MNYVPTIVRYLHLTCIYYFHQIISSLCFLSLCYRLICFIDIKSKQSKTRHVNNKRHVEVILMGRKPSMKRRTDVIFLDSLALTSWCIIPRQRENDYITINFLHDTMSSCCISDTKMWFILLFLIVSAATFPIDTFPRRTTDFIAYDSVLGYSCHLNRNCGGLVANSICLDHMCVCKTGYMPDGIMHCMHASGTYDHFVFSSGDC